MLYLSIFLILICVLLVLVVLSQNSKDGGLSGQFGGSASTSQILGARRTGDFLSNATWVLIALIFVGSILTTKLGFKGDPTEPAKSAADGITIEPKSEDAPELENLIDADSSPVIDGRLVYANNYQGNINIFDISQKRSVWTAESSSFYSPLILRGMMVLIQDNSSIKSFSTNTFLESWSSDEYRNRNLSNGVNFKGKHK